MGTAATLSTAIPGETLRLGVSLLLGALLVTAVARLRPMTRGTTLAAPWYWALAGALAVSIATVVNVSGFSGDAAPWLRYLAGATLLAAPMAVLGAKRPQDRAWQWVVLSLVALAMLPAGHQWLYHPGSELRLEPAWQWFILVIAAIGVGNYLITSRALAAIFAGLGLYCYLGEQFPSWLQIDLPARDLIGAAALSIAAALARRLPRETHVWPVDSMWREFRNLFGAAWGLRCAERFNTDATQNGWRSTLNWHGFTLPKDQPALTPAELQCLENLLRRFVSSEWISERCTKIGGECSPQATVQEIAQH